MKSLFAKKSDLEAVEKQITDKNYKRLSCRGAKRKPNSKVISSHVLDYAVQCLEAQSTQAPAKASKPISAPITQKPAASKPQAPVGRTAAQFLALSVADQNQIIRACCAQNAGAATRKEVRAAYDSADSKTRLAFYRVFKISLTSF